MNLNESLARAGISDDEELMPDKNIGRPNQTSSGIVLSRSNKSPRERKIGFESRQDSVRVSSRFDIGNKAEQAMHDRSTHFTHEFFDHASINHETPSGRQKYLVCLGDSRGLVHMSHLYLP
jgi:hypothetical protein